MRLVAGGESALRLPQRHNPSPSSARCATRSMVGGLLAIDYGCRLGNRDFIVRAGRPHEASAILELWGQARSTHATTTDFPEDVQRRNERA
jgi:hypothetical protein